VISFDESEWVEVNLLFHHFHLVDLISPSPLPSSSSSNCFEHSLGKEWQ